MLGLLRRLKKKIDNPLRGVSPDVVETIARIRERRLTYLTDQRLASLVRLARAGEAEGGAIVEAGCALGGSAILLASVKGRDTPLFVYDVFEQIPPPSERDGADVHERYATIAAGGSQGLGGDTYYGYQTDLYDKVRGSFAELGYPVEENRVSLVKGLVEDTMPVEPPTPIRLVHIDVDWYDPVTTCLERTVPFLTRSGAVVLDDYHDWSGSRRATDDYFNRIGRDRYSFDSASGHLVIRRKP